MYSFVLVCLMAIGLSGTASAQSSYPAPVWGSPSAGDFISVAESDLASFASEFPYMYVEPEVDTSDWTVYDVTCEQGSACNPAPGAQRFPSSWGCSPMVGDDATDNSAALACLWHAGRSPGSDSSFADDTILYFPNGTYNFDRSRNGVSVIRPDNASDHRGLRGESRNGTILQTTNIHGRDAQVNLVDTEVEQSVPGDAGKTNYNYTSNARVSWNGGAGAPRGTETIVVSSTNGFVDGGWVELRANSLPVQTRSDQLFRTRIVPGSITSNSFRIDRPIPDDFTGGGATAIGWRPAEELVFEHMTIRMKYPDHQLGNMNWNLQLNHVADSHIVDVKLEGYQTSLFLQNVARFRYAQNELSLFFDKPFNTYGIASAGSTHLTIIDSYFYNTPEGYSCGGSDQGIYLAFNHFAEPEPNPAYDSVCNQGDGNDCNIALSSHVSGPTAHGNTVGSGHLHCSGNLEDVLGQRGSASCHGTRSPDSSGSFLLHGPSCSNSAIVRNFFESGVWVDWQDGPGRRNFFYGNVLRAGDARQRGGLGNGGDFASKNEAGNAAFNSGHRFNPILINNSLNTLGGGSNRAFDAGVDDATVMYNVFREGCRYDGGSSPNAAIRADCGSRQTADSDVPAVNGASITWSNNTPGANDRDWSATLPSAPGFEGDPGFSGGQGDFPYIGADQGPMGGTDAGCLPAKARFNGGSC